MGAVRMVREAKKRTSTKTRFTKGNALALVLMGVFLCELLAYTWCRVQCTGVGYEITRVVREQEQLAVVQKKLQVELARLKSPERLADIAKTYMDLKMPSSRQMVIVE
jgi:cell division protein FtsL